MKPWAFVLVALAAYRLTRFLTIDTLPLVRRPREWIEKKLPEGHWLSELSVCPFCVSAYVSAGVLAAWVFGAEIIRWLITWCAVWGAASLAFAALDKDD